MDIYNKKYEEYWYSGAHGMLISSAHKLMEYGVPTRCNDRILEIGGGAMPHRKWIKKGNIKEYTISDTKTVLDKLDKKAGYKLHYFDKDPILAKLRKNYYTRIIAAQVWGHIPEPEQAMLRWVELLSENGLLSISIPCDPGILWRLGQKVASRKFMKLYNLSFEEYDIIMSREHINPVQRMLKIVNYYFGKKTVIFFPTFVPSVNLNLFCILNLSKSDFKRRTGA